MTKYEEFQQKKEALENIEPYIVSDFDLDKRYKQLLEEVLEQFKLLEDSFIVDENAKLKEWGYDNTDDDIESEEERERWNNFIRKFTKRN